MTRNILGFPHCTFPPPYLALDTLQYHYKYVPTVKKGNSYILLNTYAISLIFLKKYYCVFVDYGHIFMQLENYGPEQIISITIVHLVGGHFMK